MAESFFHHLVVTAFAVSIIIKGAEMADAMEDYSEHIEAGMITKDDIYSEFLDHVFGDALGNILVVGVLEVIVYVNFRKVYNIIEQKRPLSKKEKAAVDTYREQIKVLQAEIDQLASELRLSVVPARYHDVYSMEWLMEAMENKRADDLKEAINLYENYLAEEQHHQEQLEALMNLRIEVNT